MDILSQLHPIFAQSRFWSWIAIFVIALMITFLIKLVLKMVIGHLRTWAQKTASGWDDIVVDILDGLKAIFIFGWLFYLLSKSMAPGEEAKKVLHGIVVILSTLQIGLWGQHLIRNWRNSFLKNKMESDPSSSAALGLLYTGVQSLFIIVLVLAGLSNLGVNVAALLAGLGVGGIAVALAAQNILGDLLASLSIVLDKPFVVGDFIVAGEEKGTVEQIGIKTTRLRSLSGEQLVLSNKDLLESRVRNYKRMWQRRVIHKFGVVYSTPADTLEKIPEWIKDIVLKYQQLSFDRCHFMEYGGSSLDFELVYFIADPEFNVHMDFQQKVLIDIYRKFAAEKVEFAYPSQSVYVEKWPPGVTAPT